MLDSGQVALLCENMMSSTKPEVYIQGRPQVDALCASKKFLTEFFVVSISAASLLEFVYRHFRMG